MTRRIAIVGGGIAGLAAAWELRDNAEVTLFEAGERVGGKISMGEVGGLTIDAGADAFLARVPQATELCVELGLGGELVSPAARNAFIYSDGALRPIPAPQVLGVPLDPSTLASTGLVTAAGAELAARDLDGDDDLLVGDESIGSLVRRRLGDEVLEALVDPLLSGVNAGDVDHLSVRACAPQLAAAASSHPSLIAGLTEMVTGRADPDAPVFHSLVPGAARLVDVLAERLDSVLRLGVEVRSVSPEPDGWSVATSEGSSVTFDGVLLCLPAARAAELIADAPPMLGEIEYSSVALLTLVFDEGSVDHPLDGSGFLVQRRSGLLLTAASWSSSKWAHIGADGSVVFRASVGRDGDTRHLDLDDDALIGAVLTDLETTMGCPLKPRATRVTHYPNSLAQYRPGHLDAVEAMRSSLPPGLGVAGASFDGVGIPACIASGRTQAAALVG